MKDKQASGLILWYMEACGFDGWASLWDTAYFRDLPNTSDYLKRHEHKHLEQMERDGKIVYMIKYTYYLIRYGYRNNPYEIEARQA